MAVTLATLQPAVQASTTPTPAPLAWAPRALAFTISARVREHLGGFIPWNLHGVPCDDCTVLRLYPLTAETSTGKGPGRFKRRRLLQPWPTLYWLACPSLRAQVSRLEAVGLIPLLKAQLQRPERAALAATLRAQHRVYAEQRWGVLLPADRDLVEERRWTAVLRDSGVGGIRHAHSVGGGACRIKCLHTHLAHFLATGDNVIGEWTYAALTATDEAVGGSRPQPLVLACAAWQHERQRATTQRRQWRRVERRPDDPAAGAATEPHQTQAGTGVDQLISPLCAGHGIGRHAILLLDGIDA